MGGRDDEGLYDFAGKGARQRRRMEQGQLRRSKFKPINRSLKPSQLGQHSTKRTAGAKDDPNDLKEAIRRLVIDHAVISPAQIKERLQNDGYIATLVTISNVRKDMREVLKLLQRPDLALIDPNDLARRRRRRERLSDDQAGTPSGAAR
ncbi:MULTISPECIES: hypothetical protein [unclassified Bradyrhizobium]|uniref:hypothetical protein n=1 Tax=unclassified Bradyrhizobium TaxID=2631580 RepID=UPI00211EB081|nr:MULTISPECIES: hypothetical protein [unclassified Bradyrhizobium]